MIHKQALEVTDIQTIQVPANAQLLSVQEQRGVLTVWYFFGSETDEIKDWTFEIVGTGNNGPQEEQSYFASTVQMPSGLVWHVWVHYEF